jgi:hypothetical protein
MMLSMACVSVRDVIFHLLRCELTMVRFDVVV